MVGVNTRLISTAGASFSVGGIRQSGLDSEGSKYGLDYFLYEIKDICLVGLDK